MKRKFAWVFILVAVATSSLAAQERGTLQGRFVFDGKPPEVKQIKIPFDTKACGEVVNDESLVVDNKSRGIANVVVQLNLKRTELPPVHPQLAELRKTPREWTMESCRFEPHVVAVMTEQDFVVKNKDPVGHVLAIKVRTNPAWSDAWYGGAVIRKRFMTREVLPAHVSCSIHPWLRGYVVITDHPYVAISDAQGEFSIPELPPGKWTFRTWHERSGYVETVKQDGKATKWFKGRLTVDIRPGKNDVGKILVGADAFAEK